MQRGASASLHLCLRASKECALWEGLPVADTTWAPCYQGVVVITTSVPALAPVPVVLLPIRPICGHRLSPVAAVVRASGCGALAAALAGLPGQAGRQAQGHAQGGALLGPGAQGRRDLGAGAGTGVGLG
jgi:hypothetical protein